MWRWPVNGTVHPLDWTGAEGPLDWRITRLFGDRSVEVNGTYPAHNGLDLGNGRCGDVVVAVDAGKVVYAAADAASGGALIVIVQHAPNLRSWVAHLSRITVKVGQFVSKGQQIGLHGKSGWATGCHVHLQADRGTFESAFDPLTMIEGEEVPSYIEKIEPVPAPFVGTVNAGVNIRTEPSLSAPIAYQTGSSSSLGEVHLQVHGQAVTIGGKTSDLWYVYPVAGKGLLCVHSLLVSKTPLPDVTALNAKIGLLENKIITKDADVVMIGQQVSAYHKG